MTQDEFIHLRDAYGADLRRWPVEHRNAAAQFMTDNPDTAPTLLSAAKALDAHLDAYDVPPPSALLQARIRKAAHMQAQNSPSLPDNAAITDHPQPNRRFGWKRAAAVLAVVGIVGYGTYPLIAPVSPDPDANVWQEAAIDLGVSEIYDWVESSTE